MHYSLTRATLWNLAGYLYLIIASLIATPILLHGLGLEQFSLYSLIFAAIILVSSIDFGLPQAVVRALSHEPDYSAKRRTLWATSSPLFILSGLVGGLVAAGITSTFHVAPAILVLVFSICLMNNLIGHYLTLPHAEGRFGWYNTKTFVIGTANTFLAACLAWAGQGIMVIFLAQLLCYFITLLLLAYFSLRYFPRPWEVRPSLPVARSLLNFGLKNQAGKLVGQIQGQYGKYLLSTLTPLLLSAYVIAIGLVQKLTGGIAQVATALYPAASRNSHGPSLRFFYYRIQLGLFVVGLLGIGLFEVIGYPFLAWWLHSPELTPIVHSLMRVLTWYFAILVLTPLASSMLDGRGRPELTSLFAFVTTLVEITLALFLFPHYGLFAPVYAALTAVLLTTPALLYVTERVIRVK